MVYRNVRVTFQVFDKGGTIVGVMEASVPELTGNHDAPFELAHVTVIPLAIPRQNDNESQLGQLRGLKTDAFELKPAACPADLGSNFRGPDMRNEN